MSEVWAPVEDLLLGLSIPVNTATVFGLICGGIPPELPLWLTSDWREVMVDDARV